MIWESHYWKDDLLRHARDLRRRKEQKRWPQVSLARVEQTVMLAFYSIRKLIEATKITSATRDMEVPLTQYSWKRKPVTRMNWHKLDELYDFSIPREARRKLHWICNQIIHSYVFSVVLSETDGLDGFLFVSDRERHRHLHYISIDQSIQLLEQVGHDYPNEVHITLNPQTGDYDVKAFSHPDGRPANTTLQTDRASRRG